MRTYNTFKHSISWNTYKEAVKSCDIPDRLARDIWHSRVNFQQAREAFLLLATYFRVSVLDLFTYGKN